MQQRGWSTKGARAAREEARACHRGDDLSRLGGLAGSATRPLPGGGTHRDVVEARGVAALRHRRQRVLGICCTGKRHATALLASGSVRLAWFAQWLVDRALRLARTGLRVDQHSARGAPALARWPDGRALALRPRSQVLRTGLSPPLWRGTECGQDAGDPFAGGLCERLEIVGAVEGPLSHAGGPAVGRRPLRPVRLEPRAASSLPPVPWRDPLDVTPGGVGGLHRASQARVRREPAVRGSAHVPRNPENF